MITHAQLLELVKYDPETGLFTVLKATKRRPVGTVMNCNHMAVCRHGATPVPQTVIHVGGFGSFCAGPLAWFYMTGEWPDHDVDHHDNNGWNQRWSNLRPATRSQNQANTRRYKSNTSGLKCVFRSGGKKRPWRAQVQKDNRRISLGRFATKEEAFAAYVLAAAAHHGEYARFT